MRSFLLSPFLFSFSVYHNYSMLSKLPYILYCGLTEKFPSQGYEILDNTYSVTIRPVIPRRSFEFRLQSRRFALVANEY